MVEVQSCDMDARFSALLISGLGLEIKACALPKTVKIILTL
jgi:hypothetical protein